MLRIEKTGAIAKYFANTPLKQTPYHHLNTKELPLATKGFYGLISNLKIPAEIILKGRMRYGTK